MREAVRASSTCCRPNLPVTKPSRSTTPLAASGVVDLDGLVTGKFGLEQVEAALTASRTDPHSLKPVVYPGTQRF